MEFNNVLFYLRLDFFLIFFITQLSGRVIIQLLKFNIKSNTLVRQLLNLVIFHLALNKPYLLLLFFFSFHFPEAF